MQRALCRNFSFDVGLLRSHVSAAPSASRAPPAAFAAPHSSAPLRLPALYRGALPWTTHSSRAETLLKTIHASEAAVEKRRLDIAFDKVASIENGTFTAVPERTASKRERARRVFVGDTALSRVESAFSSFSTPARLAVHALVKSKLAEVKAESVSKGSTVARLADVAFAANEAGIRLRLLPEETMKLKAHAAAGGAAHFAAKMPYVRVKARDPALPTQPLDAAAVRLREYVNTNRAALVERARISAFGAKKPRASS